MKKIIALIVVASSFIVRAEEKPVTASESAVKWTFGGQAWVETEAGQNIGYESSSDYFNKNATAGAQRQFSHLMSILEIGVNKGATSFNLNLQVGELYFGDPTTGGSYANKSTSTNPFYVRDAFLTYNFNEMYSMNVGMQMHCTDPNGFIMSDHMPAFVLNRKHDRFFQSVWLGKMGDGKSNSNLSGSQTVDSQRADSYAGLHFDGNVTDAFGYKAYAVFRGRREFKDPALGPTSPGVYNYTWYGMTFDYAPLGNLKTQITGITNNSTYTADTGATGSGSTSSYLANARVAYTIGAIDSTVTLEGLMTSGDNGTGTSFSSRKNFVSISPKTSYLLTIASNDGADDSPGAPKQLVAPLDLRNGLNMAVVKLEHCFGKLGAFLRYGKVMTTEADATTKSSEIGDEIDLEATYELDKSTQLQFDWAQFNPGSFFPTAQRDSATLLTTSLKFKF